MSVRFLEAFLSIYISGFQRPQNIYLVVIGGDFGNRRKISKTSYHVGSFEFFVFYCGYFALELMK